MKLCTVRKFLYAEISGFLPSKRCAKDRKYWKEKTTYFQTDDTLFRLFDQNVNARVMGSGEKPARKRGYRGENCGRNKKKNTISSSS